MLASCQTSSELGGSTARLTDSAAGDGGTVPARRSKSMFRRKCPQCGHIAVNPGRAKACRDCNTPYPTGGSAAKAKMVAVKRVASELQHAQIVPAKKAARIRKKMKELHYSVRAHVSLAAAIIISI